MKNGNIMSSVKKNKRLIYSLILALFILQLTFYSCKYESNNSNENMTSIEIDSNKYISMIYPDSIFSYEIKDMISNTMDNFANIDRFFIDTVSTLSPKSLALDGKARDLQKKLMLTLPKISLTNKQGDNITRNYYIIEGDIKLDRDELYYYCLKRLQKIDTNVIQKIESRKLTIVTDRNGNPSIWPAGITIKYTIMRSSFSSKALYDTVVVNMREATNDWMKVCNIKFQYLSSLDNSEIDLEDFPDQILFIVRQINADGDFIANAFFPADPQFKRLLLLDNSFFVSDFAKTGVLRHELGHVLGFRHEHIWSTDASCSGESIIEGELGARPINRYDPYSVMHYPCGINKNNHILMLTEFDKEGARKIYPFINM